MSNSILFTVIDDQIVVRTTSGIYKQAKIAIRNSYAFAQIGGGFVQLYANGTTSNPNMRWIDMENADQYRPGSLGRLIQGAVS